MVFNQDSFNAFILENNVYGFFERPITLKSGRTSHFYANWRSVVEDAWLTEQLVNYVLDFSDAQGISADTFYGVPEGATKLGVLTQFHAAKRSAHYKKGSHVLAMGRAQPKQHGAAKDMFFVGMPQGKTVVIEDTTTTGGSLLTTLRRLHDAGVTVVAVISLTNRMEKRDDGLSVAEAVAKEGIQFYSMSSALTILPLAVQHQKPSSSIVSALKEEFTNYGVKPLEGL